MTLDVSKLSGWLNADASCRVERRACSVGRGAARPGGVRALGGGDAIDVHGEGPTQGCGGHRARAERTLNIPAMSVTWDVSKLSGWLNTLAFCRVERWACNVGRGVAREA